MNFKANHQQLVNTYTNQVSELSTNAQNFISNNTFTPDEWLQGLALCEVACKTNQLTDTVKELFKQMFRLGRNLCAPIHYDDSNYSQWFDTTIELCKMMIAAGNIRAYAEIADVYEHARLPHLNLDLSRKYLAEGVVAGDCVSMSISGYNLFFGRNLPEGAEKDPVKGRELILQAADLGYEWSELNLLIIDYDTLEPNDDLLQRMQAYAEKDQEGTGYTLLGDYYQYKLSDDEAALAAYQKGKERGAKQCRYQLAISIFNGGISKYPQEDHTRLEQEALSELKALTEYRLLHAATFLGQVYQYSESYKSIPEAIKWHEFAAAYDYPNAYTYLGIIYLYEDEVKDYVKAAYYLDLAIEKGIMRAMSEKAYHLLEVEDFGLDAVQGKMLLEKANEAGDAYAAYRLGRAYQAGEFTDAPDYEKALAYYQVAADRGNLEAMEMVGRYNRTGVAGPADRAKAMTYLQKAIDLNSNYARVEMASCYEQAPEGEQDYQKAFDLLMEAANNDYFYAYVRLGYYYTNGVLVEADQDKAFECFSKAAEAGIPEAQYNVGRMYKYAIGRPENPSLAIEFFTLAAAENDTDAHVELGLAYEHEYGGLEFDAQKAFFHISQAAAEGLPYAEYKLGYYYYYGMVDRDIEKGLEWLEKADEDGSPFAALVLGDHYLYGRNSDGESYYDKAFAYFNKAQEAGYVSEGLGLCYQYGLGVEQSDSQAFKFYGLAAEQGYIQGKFRLGMCHKLGLGTDKNASEAYAYLAEAAEEGIHNAQYELGMMLIAGKEIEKDEARGIHYLSLAAEEEHDDSQLELGNCYLMGKGVDADEVKAMYWYQKAADNGNEQAQKLTGKRKRGK